MNELLSLSRFRLDLFTSRLRPLTVAVACVALLLQLPASVLASVPARPVPEHMQGHFSADLAAADDPSYNLLDNVEGDWVNVAAFPVRPLTLTPDGAHGYAVNTYGNTVVHFDPTLQPIDVFRTLWAPVSVATYVTPTDGPNSDQLLVVSQLSNALVFHNRQTGDIFDLLELPAQPADILVLQEQNLAFVSATGTDVVVEIDLITRTITREFAIPARKPTFLSVRFTEAKRPEVFVAPRWSTNNSVVDRMLSDHNTQAGPDGILDLADSSVATVGLPDEDLFFLNRLTGQAEPVATGMGTLLFAQDFNPGTGRLWQLNSEANNKDPNRQNEPAIQGISHQNRLTIFDVVVGATGAPAPADIKDLDLAATGSFSPTQSVGTPFSLDFSAGGIAFVAGLMTDNVSVYDLAGNWILEWDLPTGCVPRQVLLDPTEQYAAVYCSGLNTVPVYFLTVPPLLVGTVDLGFDPSPADIQDGRRIFFDASNSVNNNISCASCHDDGAQDLLAWDLSNADIDDKGAMVTQTLFGVNRSRHHHWRAEQLADVADFNPTFVGLFGGSELPEGPGSEFEKFERFILSLEHPANPNQAFERVLDDSIQPPILSPDQDPDSSAIAGRDTYEVSCRGCHHLPTGTSNDVIGDGAVFNESRPKRQWLQVAHLWDVVNKGIQPDFQVTFADGSTQLYPRQGVGLAHSGNPRNIFHFADFFFPSTDPRTSNTANFLFQFDNGLAPAAHARRLMNARTATAATNWVTTAMLPQVASRNADLAVFGRTTIGGTNRIWGWVFDRVSGRFLRDDNVLQPLSFFTNAARAGDWFAFVGQPVGMGPGFAIDFDRDEYPNGLEQLTPVDGRFVVDTDGDGDWDGHEWLNGGDPLNPAIQSNDTTVPSIPAGAPTVAWQTSKIARLLFETDELSTASLTLVPNFPQLQTLTFNEWQPTKIHALIAHDLYPNVGTAVQYTGTLTLTDLAGLTQSYPVAVTPEPFTDLPTVVIASSLQFGPILWSVPAGSMNTTATVNVINKQTQVPQAGQHVIAKVTVNGVAQTAANLVSSPNSFCVANVPYVSTPPFIVNPVPGPFVISGPTDAAGNASLTFNLHGLTSGDVVTLTLEAINPVDSSQPICTGTVADPNLLATVGGVFPSLWSFPDTPRAARAVGVVVP